MLRQRNVQAAIVVWIASVVFVVLAGRTLPFDWPHMTSMASSYQLMSAHAQILWALFLIAVIVFVTRGRPVADLAARAPAPEVNRAELLVMVAYAIVAQVVGVGLGRLVGIYPVSLHFPGTVFGISTQVSVRDVYAWVAYNFVVYAVIPYAAFRARGYSNEALSLKSSVAGRTCC